MAERTSSQRDSSNAKRASGMETVFRTVAIITAIAILTEFFLAGLGVFDGVHSGATAGDTAAFDPHKAVGYLVAGLGAVALIVAAVARLGGRIVGMTAALVLLAGPVQALLAHAGEDDGAAWGALHGLVGALILALAVILVRAEPQR